MLEYTKERINQAIWDLRHHLALFFRDSLGSVLIVQEEGIGNAILTTPMIQALSKIPKISKIDVLINEERNTRIIFENLNKVNNIFDRNKFNSSNNMKYHYVLECHPRHYLPRRIKYLKRLRIPIKIKNGLDYHWCFHKHESDYLLELANDLGYIGLKPPTVQLTGDSSHGLFVRPNSVAIGIGYFKGNRADGRDWSDRHWGNNNYIELCKRLKLHGYNPILVGDILDFEKDGHILSSNNIESICGKLNLTQTIDYLGKCYAYIGNDTGLMHIAASLDIITIGIFVNTNSIKSHPLGRKCGVIGGDQGPHIYRISVNDVWEKFQEIKSND